MCYSTTIARVAYLQQGHQYRPIHPTGTFGLFNTSGTNDIGGSVVSFEYLNKDFWFNNLTN